MKRILSAFLVVLFVISLAGFASIADEMGSTATPAPVKKHHHGSHKKKAPAAEPTEPPASTK